MTSKHRNELIQKVQLFYAVTVKMGDEHVCQSGKHDKYEGDLYYKRMQRTEEDDGKTRARGVQVVGATGLQRGR